MEQIKDNKLCFYCLGCNKLGDEQFNGVMNCRNFMTGRNIEEFYKNMKRGNRNGM